MSATALIGALAEGGAKGMFSGIGQLAKDIRTAITGKDPAKEAEIAEKLMELEYAAESAQALVNIEEAKNPNVFVSGWRPAAGWTCSIALAWFYVLSPFASWVAELCGSAVKMPVVDISTLYPLLLALLGMGGLRSFDKASKTKKD